MKVKDLYPSTYLKKEDVPVPTTATIKSVTQDQIGGDGDKELKPVLSFVGNLKPMVLNKGNATTLAEHFGDDTSTWPGKTIEVYTDPSVTFQGKRVGGVRVRVPSGAALPAAAAINGMSRELWDVSDGQKVIKNKSSDEVREFLANCPVPREQVKIKPAGAAREMAKAPEEYGFLVAEGDDANDETPF